LSRVVRRIARWLRHESQKKLFRSSPAQIACDGDDKRLRGCPTSSAERPQGKKFASPMRLHFLTFFTQQSITRIRG
jgi:hypothetical protein